MNRLLLFTSLIFLSVFASSQGLENIIVEKYYISDANDNDPLHLAGGPLPVGSVTYRIFVDMAPGYILQAVYASPTNLHELEIKTTTSFFNNEDRGATTANAIASTQLMSNTVMLDSWISLGAAAAGKMGVLKADDTDGAISNVNGLLQNTDPLAGIPIKTQDGIITGTPAPVSMAGLDAAISVFDNINAGPEFYTTDGTWYTAPGASGPTPDNRVLIAQITTDGILSFKLNLQIRRESDFKVEKYVHSNPLGNEILCEKCNFNGVITSLNDNYSKRTSTEFKIFPNPAQNTLNIELGNGCKEYSNYSIIDILGNLLIKNKVNSESEIIIRDIDISFLPKGLYFIRLASSDGVLVSVKKFIKNQ